MQENCSKPGRSEPDIFGTDTGPDRKRIDPDQPRPERTVGDNDTLILL